MSVTISSFTESEWEFYNDGSGGASEIVGYADGVDRIIRYKFTTPAEGATKLSFKKKNVNEYDSSIGSSEKLRFYVGTDSQSHKNPNATTRDEYHGTVAVSSGTATGSADILLLPNTTYYLFIFAGYTTYGAYYWNYAGSMDLTLDGAAGLVHIDTGAEIITAMPYIDNGTDWQLALPYADDSTSWKNCC